MVLVLCWSVVVVHGLLRLVCCVLIVVCVVLFVDRGVVVIACW